MLYIVFDIEATEESIEYAERLASVQGVSQEQILKQILDEEEKHKMEVETWRVQAMETRQRKIVTLNKKIEEAKKETTKDDRRLTLQNYERESLQHIEDEVKMKLVRQVDPESHAKVEYDKIIQEFLMKSAADPRHAVPYMFGWKFISTCGKRSDLITYSKYVSRFIEICNEARDVYNCDYPTLFGFNINGYDIPLVRFSLAKRGLEIPKWWPSNDKWEDKRRRMDLMQMFMNYSNYGGKVGCSLEELAVAVGLTKFKKTIHIQDLLDAMKEEKDDIVLTRLTEDVTILEQIGDRLGLFATS